MSYKPSLILFILIFLPFISSCSGEGAEEEATDAACLNIGLYSKVINGRECGGLDNSPVLRLAIVKSDGSVGLCTGSLVTPDVILTAAHCVAGSLSQIIIGYGDPYSINIGNAIYYEISPGYKYIPSTGRLFNDVALVFLANPINLPVMPILLSRGVNAGEYGYVYGYGAENYTTQPDFSNGSFLNAGAMTVREVTQNHLFVYFDGEGVNVCNGDSGGPMVVMVGGQPALAGVASQGSAEGCIPGDTTTFINLHSPELLNWLAAKIPRAYVR